MRDSFPDEAARYAQDVRDPFSSAWREAGTDPPVVPARTWLLSVGWRRCAGTAVVLLVSAATPVCAGHSAPLTGRVETRRSSSGRGRARIDVFELIIHRRR